MSDRPGARLYLSPPHLSGRELDHVQEAFAANQVAPAGPFLQRFEQAFADYAGIPHAVSLASGTAAIHLALRMLDAEPGREVWTSSLTFIGGVGPIAYERLTPVFFDCDPATWCLDPRLLARRWRGRRAKIVCLRRSSPPICSASPATSTRSSRSAGRMGFR